MSSARAYSRASSARRLSSPTLRVHCMRMGTRLSSYIYIWLCVCVCRFALCVRRVVQYACICSYVTEMIMDVPHRCNVPISAQPSSFLKKLFRPPLFQHSVDLSKLSILPCHIDSPFLPFSLFLSASACFCHCLCLTLVVPSFIRLSLSALSRLPLSLCLPLLDITSWVGI